MKGFNVQGFIKTLEEATKENPEETTKETQEESTGTDNRLEWSKEVEAKFKQGTKDHFAGMDEVEATVLVLDAVEAIRVQLNHTEPNTFPDEALDHYSQVNDHLKGLVESNRGVVETVNTVFGSNGVQAMESALNMLIVSLTLIVRGFQNGDELHKFQGMQQVLDLIQDVVESMVAQLYYEEATESGAPGMEDLENLIGIIEKAVSDHDGEMPPDINTILEKAGLSEMAEYVVMKDPDGTLRDGTGTELTEDKKKIVEEALENDNDDDETD